MDTIALIIAATEYVRRLIPESAHKWAIPLVALVVTAMITVLFVDKPFTLEVARAAVVQWFSSIGLTALGLRMADKAAAK